MVVSSTFGSPPDWLSTRPTSSIEGRVRAHVGLFDPGCREHALQAAIERSGAEIQTAVGLHRHILTNGVAMTLTIGNASKI